MANRNFHVHLVSDSTGETVSSVARACLVQYEGIFVQEHVWSLVRTMFKVASSPGDSNGRLFLSSCCNLVVMVHALEVLLMQLLYM